MYFVVKLLIVIKDSMRLRCYKTLAIQIPPQSDRLPEPKAIDVFAETAVLFSIIYFKLVYFKDFNVCMLIIWSCSSTKTKRPILV